jgi:uncharacterized protein (TIGR00251 family)
MPWLKTHKDHIELKLYIQPGASKTEIVGLHGDSLKIKIKSPPVEGEANLELLKFLQKKLKLKKDQLELIRGEKSRNKVVLITDVEEFKIRNELK